MQIKGIRKIEGNYKLNKTKEEEKQPQIMEPIAEKTKIQEANVGCFQLVVMKKEPWYRKFIKAIGNLFKKNKQKGIVLK